VLDGIRITDNDIHDVDGSGIYFSSNHHWLLIKQAVTRLIHFKVLRNRLRNIGSRVIGPKARGRVSTGSTASVFSPLSMPPKDARSQT